MVAVAVSLAAPPAVRAEAWHTVLDVEGTPSRSLMVDPFTPETADVPDLIVSGDLAADAGTDRVFRLVQSLQPAQLEPLDAVPATVYSMAASDAGDLYWAGSGTVPFGSASAWMVRRSDAAHAGTQWQDLDAYQLAAGRTSRARGMAIDAAGRLFACGLGIDAAGYSHWLVRRSTDQGGTWTESDLFRSGGASSLLTGLDVVEALGIAVGRGSSDGALFVVGTVGKRYYGSWTVTRSLDGGESWEVVDTAAWVPKSLSSSSRARKVATDAGGRVFVLGDTGGRSEVDPAPWALRMSASAGDPGSWVTVFGPWRQGPCPYPLDLAIDAHGNVWMVGVIHTAYGRKNVTYTTSWTVVRLQENGDGSWTPTTYFPLGEAPGTYRAAAQAVTTDAQGRVYVSGNYTADDLSPRRWIVQRFDP